MGLGTLLDTMVLRANNILTFSTSFDLPVNTNSQGISNPPCVRSEEYLLPPIGVQVTYITTLAKNREQIRDLSWNMADISLSTTT